MIAEKLRMWNQTFNESEQDRLFLGIPILISIIMKLVLLLFLYNSPINNDGTLYINAAKQYAMGNFAAGLAYYPMPAYPLLLSFVHIVIPGWIMTGYFISMVSMVLVTIPLYYLTKTMFGVKAGFFTCIIFAFLPRMNEWSMNISRDPLFAFLFILCAYCALKFILERNLFLFGATFVLAWCATLVRIEGVIFIVFYFLALAYFAIVDKENRSCYGSRALIWIGIPIGIALLALFSSGIRGIAVNRFDYVFAELSMFFSGEFLTKPTAIYHFLSEAMTHPPFYDGHYSFAALCRHFMPVIYIFGILQILVKILFPLSFIPLYVGFKNRRKPFDNNDNACSGKFILWICILYIGLGYYFLIDHDFIATRYLIIPAFLLLPWIGHGLVILYEKINASPKKTMIIALILIIILAPAAKTFKLISSRETIVVTTAKWLKDNDKTAKMQIVSNNRKDAFYIELEAEDNSNWKTHFYNQRKRKALQSIEEFALEKNAQIIVFKTKTKYADKVETFQFYQKINSFVGKKYTIFIYDKMSKK
ncbi:MAG: glycosyltransferase family 39 protein [Desulfobacteraceae bacterium]|nr:glycosyltransferase family 39 protein [Desulfobacteraceae bacterium]